MQERTLGDQERGLCVNGASCAEWGLLATMCSTAGKETKGTSDQPDDTVEGALLMDGLYLLYLLLAIVLEVAGTTMLKISNGMSRLMPSTLMFALYGLSFAVYAVSLRKIDVSVSYALWSGIGTALIAVVGVLLFKESLSWLKLLSLVLIIGGVIGLNLSGAAG
jgi:small multidrug resistance pump